MEIGYVYIRPVGAIYVRSYGPYKTSAARAWDTMLSWLDRNGLRNRISCGYGIINDPPGTTLPLGLGTDVGQRGESLSAGERQLVALARAYLADPDLLVLDEATSAVDPSTEVRLQRALDSLTRGRTSIAIAHRLSTAEAADEVVVVDAGRIVERGHHTELVGLGGVYTRLHQSWSAQQRAL